MTIKILSGAAFRLTGILYKLVNYLLRFVDWCPCGLVVIASGLILRYGGGVGSGFEPLGLQ